MRHSDVFEEYVKISEQKGLIKKAEVFEDDEEKYKDKEWKANLEALYGIKIDYNESKDNLINQAHPETMIAAESYDKTNGLVPNNFEHQDIVRHTLENPPIGMLNPKKYADELLTDLIKIGFEAENYNEDEIRILADSCAERLVNDGFEKQAQWLAALKWTPKILLGIASIVGFDVLKDRTMGLVSNGIQPDIERAVEKLTKLQEVALPEGKQEASKWLSVLSSYKAISEKAIAIMSKPSMIPGDIKTMEGLIWALEHAPKVQGTQEELDYVHNYIKVSSNLLSHIPVAVEKIKGLSVQKENSGWGEFVNNVKSLWETARGNEATDAGLALEALETSIKNTIKAYVDAIPDAKQATIENKGILENLQSQIAGLTSSAPEKGGEFYSKPTGATNQTPAKGDGLIANKLRSLGL